ncbi:hypothetical protein N7466_007425 [Penicillium verhagenii]|uniref:uncharacterized protein n=1 Tax=Penicillium verhagenii TaxID=1562060 RepID=UPI00254568C5|nr:uncharacterized protein N7466_007425 [Penicillium verhagenii]KAJ5928469.1 hypothetical protein N7466_007425 [Penicillium verhagenii]
MDFQDDGRSDLGTAPLHLRGSTTREKTNSDASSSIGQNTTDQSSTLSSSTSYQETSTVPHLSSLSLIEKYFDVVQDANPIFSKDKFLHDYQSSLCDPELVSAITTITLKLIGSNSPEDEHNLDARIARLLSSSLLEDDIIGTTPSLDQFRKACILAFYDFHQFPGHQSWMRIGQITRMAYRTGLDRLESLRELYDDWGSYSNDEIQEWRSVWWCIYRLDSYSNLSSGTPYLIEHQFVNTSFILDYSHHSPGDSATPQEVHLPSDYADLYKLLPVFALSPKTFSKNVHLLSIAAMRQTGTAKRMHFARPRDDMTESLANIQRQISTLSLSLPPGFFNPARNAFANESHEDHHARLVTVLHLMMARLLLTMLSCAQAKKDKAMVLLTWQQVLEVCQDIASVMEQWNSLFCMKVDPAISFIPFTALVFLDLHKKSTAMDNPTLQTKIQYQQTVLRLNLEEFAKRWTLPRLLNLSFAGFSESVSGPLSHRHIFVILSRFESPLHPRWLQFLSTAQAHLDSVQDAHH